MADNQDKIQARVNSIIGKIDESIERIKQYLSAPDIDDAVKEAEADIQTISEIEPVLKRIKTPVSKEEYKFLHILKQLLVQLDQQKKFDDIGLLDKIEAKLKELSSS